MRFTKKTRKVKCKKCGISTICYTDNHKKVNICPDCLDGYKKTRINCTSCKKSFKREDEYISEESQHKTKNFCCEKCYNDYVNEMNEKDKMDKWLKDYFKVETLTSRIYMQMDDFKNKKNISYKWSFATLRYIVNIKGEELQDGTIGIIPYMVDECKEHVSHLNKVKRMVEESKECRAKFSDETVIIKDVDINKERDKVLNRKIISESDLKGVIVW